MIDLMSILKIFGTLTALVTAFFALRRFFHWIRPIRIVVGIKRIFDGSSPDQILATITNKCNEDQVIVRCFARSAYPIRIALLRHLKKPFTHPRLYRNIWYGAICFELMDNDQIKIAPYERKELNHSLSNHPLSLFLTPLIQIEVELSNGRTFRSKRIEIPERWLFKSPRFARANMEAVRQNTSAKWKKRSYMRGNLRNQPLSSS